MSETSSKHPAPTDRSPDADSSDTVVSDERSMVESAATMSAQPTEVRPGDLLAGKYRVERVLGAGGMGIVLAAMHLELDRLVAIKLLHQHVSLEREFVQRFTHEARIAARLTSEHVARVLDVARTEHGTPFIVMEYLKGADLGQVLTERGRLPPIEAVTYVLEAMEAIAEAHHLGLVHRDLKPANLFRAERTDGSFLTKVLDFGISKDNAHKSTKLTAPNQLLGSPAYMSPEQVLAERQVDHRSDIWSLGVVLYELLSGEMPFNGATVSALSVQITTAEPTSLSQLDSSIPPGLGATVMKCLEKQRSGRHQSTAELARDLAPFASEEAQLNVQRISRRHSQAHPQPKSTQAQQLQLGEAQQPATATQRSWSDSAATPASSRRSISRTAIAGTAAVTLLGGIAAWIAFDRHEIPQTAASSAASASATAAFASPPPTASAARVTPPEPTSAPVPKEVDAGPENATKKPPRSPSVTGKPPQAEPATPPRPVQPRPRPPTPSNPLDVSIK